MPDEKQSAERMPQRKKDTVFATSFLNIVVWILIGVIIGFVVYTMFIPQDGDSTSKIPSNQTNGIIITNKTITAAPQPPSNFSVTLLTDSACKDCNSTYSLYEQLKAVAPNMGLTFSTMNSIDSSSAEGQALLKKYSITKTPALLVSWEANASSNFVLSWVPMMGTRESDGTFVYRNVYPPYHNLTNNVYVGYVKFTGIDLENCSDCANTSSFMNTFASPNYGVVFSNTTFLTFNSSEAQKLITKYNITVVPTFIMDSESMNYPSISSYWTTVETPEVDGSVVYRGIYPPYYSIQNKTIIGRVTLVELVDKSCASCYNVSMHYIGLKASFYIAFSNRTQHDINSSAGTALLKKYNITAVPTIILSPDVEYYPDFKSAWGTMSNSIEKDGWYVFRDFSSVKGLVYKNLTTGNLTTS